MEMKVYYEFRNGDCLVVPADEYLVNGKCVDICQKGKFKIDFNPYHDKRGRFTTKGGAANEVFVRPKYAFVWDVPMNEGESDRQWFVRAKALVNESAAYMDKHYKESEDRIRKYIGKDTMSMNLREHLDPDVVKSIADSMDDFAKKFPDIEGAIDFIRCDDMRYSTVASFNMTENRGNGIELNIDVFKNKKTLRSTHEKDRATNFHPKNTDEYQYVQHELAHALEHKMNKVLFDKGRYEAVRKGRDGIIDNKMRNVNLSQELFDKALKEYGAETISKEVSRYATSSPQEFFAECISEYTNSPKSRPIASKISKDFVELVREKWKATEE